MTHRQYNGFSFKAIPGIEADSALDNVIQHIQGLGTYFLIFNRQNESVFSCTHGGIHLSGNEVLMAINSNGQYATTRYQRGSAEWGAAQFIDGYTARFGFREIYEPGSLEFEAFEALRHIANAK